MTEAPAIPSAAWTEQPIDGLARSFGMTPEACSPLAVTRLVWVRLSRHGSEGDGR